jgi:hypothetical protein
MEFRFPSEGDEKGLPSVAGNGVPFSLKPADSVDALRREAG